MSDIEAILAKLRKQLEALEATSLSPTTVVDDPPPLYDAGDTAGFDAIEKTLESPETQKTLQDEIARLGTAAQEVEIAFWNVSQGLADILTVAEKVRPEDSSKLEGFCKDWDGYHKKYIELVRESRRVAGNARAVALDFAGDFIDVMKDEGCSVEEKRQEIEGYREVLKKDMDNATKLEDGFKDLHNEVVDFRKDIMNEPCVWAKETEEKLNALLDDIERVEKELEAAKNTAIKVTIAGTGVGVADGILTAIGVVCPVLWIASTAMFAIGTYSAVHAGYKYLGLLENRRKMKKQLDVHAKSADSVSGIIANVNALGHDIAFIQEKLAIFARVWAIIHSDLNALEKELELASTTKGKPLFQKRMRTVSAGYKTLALALRLYETDVHIKRYD